MFELAIYIIALVLVVALMPTPKSNVKPASLADIDAPTAEPGRPIPVVFGTVLLKSPNVVWYGDFMYIPIYA